MKTFWALIITFAIITCICSYSYEVPKLNKYGLYDVEYDLKQRIEKYIHEHCYRGGSV